MDKEFAAAGAIVIVAILLGVVLAAGISLGIGFFIAKALAAYTAVAYTTVLWLGVSAVVLVFMMMAS